MKHNQKTINVLLAASLLFVMTACGGGSGSGSNMSSVKDSDGDGFHDAIDPAPNDPSNPGDFSSPEKILDNPKIKEVLQIAKEHGVDINPQLGKNPPNLTGYYATPASGTTVATETGRDVGRRFVAEESRVRTKGERYEKASVYYDGGEAIGFSYSKGSFLRGEGEHFTVYSPYKDTCTEAGSNYSTYGIGIRSAVWDPKSGIISSGNFINVRLRSSGTLTAACDSRKVGGAQSKWVVGREVPSTKIDDASDLNYMCVDDNKAYIPNETWTNSDKQSCRCTTDYEVECN